MIKSNELDNNIVFESDKNIVVLSSENNPIAECLLRVFVEGRNVDYLTSNTGLVQVNKSDIDSLSQTEFLMVAQGYVCKILKLEMDGNRTDTIYLEKGDLHIKDTASIFFASIPPNAYILKDSLCIGKTNTREIKLNTGKNSLRFIAQNYRDLTVNYDILRGKNKTHMVRLNKN